jgi:hypothetical protein
VGEHFDAQNEHTIVYVFIVRTQASVAYCKRNQELPGLLGSLETDLTLFPSLYAVTRPAAQTATSTVFLGLLSCSDAIGPFTARECHLREFNRCSLSAVRLCALSDDLPVTQWRIVAQGNECRII